MRVATIASLAVAAAVGLTPAAQACSLDHASGPLSTLSTAVSKTVESVVAAVTGGGATASAGSGTGSNTPASSASTGNTFITNTTTNNTTNVTNVTNPNQTQANQNGAGGAAAGGGTGTGGTGVAAAVAAPASFGGGGGAGGGGGSLGGGSFGGSSGISGVPINPSADLSLPTSTVAFASGGSGGVESMLASDTTPVDETPGVTFAMAGPQKTVPALTSGVAIASSLPATGGPEEGSALPIAAISRAGLSATGPSVSSAFSFDGPAAEPPPIRPRSFAMLLSGLGGVGVLGAAWAWRQLV